MFSQFKPTWMLRSIYDLTPCEAQKNNIKVVLTDLDNTLIAWNDPQGTPQLRQWLIQMQNAKISVIVITNNSEKRAQYALNQLKLPFIARALKPFDHGIKQAMKRYGVSPNEVVMVGDQMMTDILAANNAHVRSILVKPLVDSDALGTKINRFFEKQIKKILVKKGQLKLNWRQTLDE